jgi:hypothetical protein
MISPSILGALSRKSKNLMAAVRQRAGAAARAACSPGRRSSSAIVVA